LARVGRRLRGTAVVLTTGGERAPPTGNMWAHADRTHAVDRHRAHARAEVRAAREGGEIARRKRSTRDAERRRREEDGAGQAADAGAWRPILPCHSGILAHPGS